MTLQEHSCHLGGLIANFHSLELVIRAYLYNKSSNSSDRLVHGKDIYTYPVGSILPSNELTDFDSLRILIGKINSHLREMGEPDINSHLADIRDALAHGRVSTSTTVEQMKLIKFSKPDNGLVKIVFNEEMTEEWFRSNKKRVVDAIHHVKRVMDNSKSNQF